MECVRGDRRLFRDVNFSLAPGTLVQLTGANGSGKTSLLRILAGLMTPERGKINWQGKDIRALAEDYCRDLTYIGHRNGVKEELSSVENLLIASGVAGSECSNAEAVNALQHMGLAGREYLPARLLSEGQRRRSALARLLTGDTTLWLLDEVFASLDEAARALVESVISEHLAKGGIAIVATHQELHIGNGVFRHLELGSTSGDRKDSGGWAF